MGLSHRGFGCFPCLPSQICPLCENTIRSLHIIPNRLKKIVFLCRHHFTLLFDHSVSHSAKNGELSIRNDSSGSGARFFCFSSPYQIKTFSNTLCICALSDFVFFLWVIVFSLPRLAPDPLFLSLSPSVFWGGLTERFRFLFSASFGWRIGPLW